MNQINEFVPDKTSTDTYSFAIKKWCDWETQSLAQVTTGGYFSFISTQ